MLAGVLLNARRNIIRSAVRCIASPAPTTLKGMVFMDGTWAYYNLVEGQGFNSGKMVQMFGAKWQQQYRIDWQRLPRVIASSIRHQLWQQSTLSTKAEIDIVRTHVFTGARPSTPVGSLRDIMIDDFTQSHFDVHRFVNKLQMEKCVDIALAVEMLYLATVPDAYDIAVIVTGDKDFMPVLERTRMLGKRVAICATRANVSQDLIHPQARTRDFDVIWLDDHVDDLLVPVERNLVTTDRSTDISARPVVDDSGSEGLDDDVVGVTEHGKPLVLARYSKAPRTRHIGSRTDKLHATWLSSVREVFQQRNTSQISSRDLGRALNAIHLEDGRTVLGALKDEYGSLFNFCTFHNDFLAVEVVPGVREFIATLVAQEGVDQSPSVVVGREVSSGGSGAKLEPAGDDATVVEVVVSGNGNGAAIGVQPPNPATSSRTPNTMDQEAREAALLQCVLKVFVQRGNDILNSNRMGRDLMRIGLDGSSIPSGSDGNALKVLKTRHGSLLRFCQVHSDHFTVRGDDPAAKYEICLRHQVSVHGEASSSGENESAARDNSAVPSVSEAWPVQPNRQDVAEERKEYSSLVALSAALVEGMGTTSSQSVSQDSLPQEGSASTDAKQTVAELKAVLRGLGLRVSGTKAELLDRIEEHRRSQLYGWSAKNE